jgi:RNA polymerase sigma-70 factor (ECF subfamily)
MPPHAGRHRFATTRWSLVLAAAGSASAEGRAAFGMLCETYWLPVYDFIRCTGRSADDARDLTQAFFARVLEKNDFRTARSERGRFRSFLLTAVRHFIANQAEHDRAAKRGGGQVHLPIGSSPRDDPQRFVDPPCGETPESIYERRWALAALNAAMARLRSEYERDGRQRLFETLQVFLTDDDGASSAACAKALGVADGSIRVALHRMRRRFGQCLRETLAETVSDPADVDDELEFLLQVISRRQASTSLERSDLSP